MKPHVVCHMITSLDGSLHPSRFTASPDGSRADWSGLLRADPPVARGRCVDGWSRHHGRDEQGRHACAGAAVRGGSTASFRGARRGQLCRRARSLGQAALRRPRHRRRPCGGAARASASPTATWRSSLPTGCPISSPRRLRWTLRPCWRCSAASSASAGCCWRAAPPSTAPSSRPGWSTSSAFLLLPPLTVGPDTRASSRSEKAAFMDKVQLSLTSCESVGHGAVHLRYAVHAA